LLKKLVVQHSNQLVELFWAFRFRIQIGHFIFDRRVDGWIQIRRLKCYGDAALPQANKLDITELLLVISTF
jgi:hypothetical protein